MSHPVIHAEIRSADSDATRAFFSELFGWTYSDGAFPGYTFVDTGVDGALPTAIGPLQGGNDAVLFFVGVEDVAACARGATWRADDSTASGGSGRDVWRLRRSTGSRRRRGGELGGRLSGWRLHAARGPQRTGRRMTQTAPFSSGTGLTEPATALRFLIAPSTERE